MADLWFGAQPLDTAAWWQLFGHFALLSLLAIGGAITTVPDMQRFVVGERAWLSDAQFSGSVALAQAAPGPNVLFVAVIGFNIGGLPGLLATLGGSLLPSTALVLGAARWGARRRDHPALRAFTEGLAPVTIGLLLSTSWVLTDPVRTHWGVLPLVTGTVLFMLRTKLTPLWPIAAGAAAGMLGFV
jgi:chromate transporter